jgi:hypothetical protein
MTRKKHRTKLSSIYFRGLPQDNHSSSSFEVVATYLPFPLLQREATSQPTYSLASPGGNAPTGSGRGHFPANVLVGLPWGQRPHRGWERPLPSQRTRWPPHPHAMFKRATRPRVGLPHRTKHSTAALAHSTIAGQRGCSRLINKKCSNDEST